VAPIQAWLGSLATIQEVKHESISIITVSIFLMWGGYMKQHRPQELIDLSEQLAKDTAAFYKAGGKKPVCQPHQSYTVAELKEKGLIDVDRILISKARKRPSV